MSDVLPLQLVAVTRRDLHTYEITCTMRLVSKELCALLADAVVPIRLGRTHGAAAPAASSHAVPLHAVMWALTDAPTRRSLTLKTLLRLLEVAVSRCQTEDQLRQLEPVLSRFSGPVTFDAPDRHGRLDCKELVLDPALAAAAASNRTALLWLRSRGWPLDRDGLLHNAAHHADLPFLQWLHTTFLQPQPPATAPDSSPSPSPSLKDTILISAAVSTTPDTVDKVEWLLSQGCCASGDAAYTAARQGNLPALQLLTAQGNCTLDERALQDALCGGHTHVADWLVRQGYCSLTTQGGYEAAFEGAASGGSMVAMQWVQQQVQKLQQQGEEVWKPRSWLYQKCLLDAAKVGACAEVLDWFVGLGADPRMAHLVITAARSGSSATVRHLMGLGARAVSDSATLRWAACCKDIAMFKLLMIETECKLGEQVTSVTVRNLAGRGTPDSLEVLQWFIGMHGSEYVHGKYGCAVMEACWAGDVAVVRWLVEELGHPIGPNALNAAAHSGCCALVELLLSYGHVSTRCRGDSYVNAAEQGDLGMLQLLWERQVPWDAGGLVGVGGAGVRVCLTRAVQHCARSLGCAAVRAFPICITVWVLAKPYNYQYQCHLPGVNGGP